MTAKVIKVLIIKNDLNSEEKEIYCVKLSLNEDLAGLKEKLYIRCSLLKDLEYQIFWIDSENDEILITCDDDFKFFVDESHVSKLFVRIIQDENTEDELQPIRKRLHSQSSDDQQTKKLRAQMESIVLSSSGSSSSDLEGIINDANFTATSNSTSLKKVIQDVNENSKDKELMMEVEPSTSKSMITSKQMNPNILNVEYLPNICLKSTEDNETTEANSTATLTSSAIKNEQEEVTNDVNEQIQPNICSKVVITGKNTTVKDNVPKRAFSIKKLKSKKTTQSSVVNVDCSSDDKSGNDLNREFATTNFSEPILRTFITVHKTNKAAQNIRKKKAIIADLKAHDRRGRSKPRCALQTAGPFSRLVFPNNSCLMNDIYALYEDSPHT